MKFKKIISVAVAFMLCFSIYPAGAYATNDVSLAGDASAVHSENLDFSDQISSSISNAISESAMALAQVDTAAQVDVLDAAATINQTPPGDASNLDIISFVYIEQPEVSQGGAQNLVVGLADETLLPSKSTLNLQNVSTNEYFSFDHSNVVDGAVLYSFDTASLPCAEYSLASIEIEKGAEITSVDLTQDSAVEYKFTVTETSNNEGDQAASGDTGVEAVSPEADNAPSGDASISNDSNLTVFTLDESGDIVAQDNSAKVASDSPDANVQPQARAVSRKDNLVVAIDAGHGGRDPGASYNGLRESDVNLSIAKYCEEELKTYKGVEVVMTRTDDTYVGLVERVEIAAEHNADVFVSIHNNAFPSASAHGAEVIVPNNASYYYKEAHVVGAALGKKILTNIVKLGLTYRRVYDKDATNGDVYPGGDTSDYFTVINESRRLGIPGIIVEHAFLSNDSDANFLKDENNLKALGVADANGIVAQYGLTKHIPVFGYDDIEWTTPGVDAIGWLAASGITTTHDTKLFDPYNTCTRSEFATFLYRALGKPSFSPSADLKSRYADVNESDYFAVPVWWLTSLGATSGDASGKYSPYAAITRGEIANTLFKLAGSPDYPRNAKKFHDVQAGNPYYDAINWLSSYGIAGGYPDGSFGVNDSALRYQIAIILQRFVRDNGFVSIDSDHGLFPDVKYGEAHSNDIWWLHNQGITTGYDTGEYGYYNDVTREQMAIFLYRMQGKPSVSAEQISACPFVDIDKAYTLAAEAITWLKNEDLTTGTTPTTYSPHAYVSRGEMAAFMNRYYDRFRGSVSIEYTPTSASHSLFEDVSGDHKFANNISWIAAYGVALGYNNGLYGPENFITRGEMASMISRLTALMKNVWLDGDASTPEIRQPVIPPNGLSIMGPAGASATEMATLFNSLEKPYNSDVYHSKGAPNIQRFCEILIEEANAEGVRAEIVFAQAMKETGWLQFGGQVSVNQCNFAGIGATNPDGDKIPAGATFKDVRTGLRAQVQHLKAYATSAPLNNECVDPRYHIVGELYGFGCAPGLYDLNGKWAVPGTDYGQGIQRIIDQI